MTPELSIALIAAIPPTLAAVLAFASSRSVKRSVGPTNGVPLVRLVELLDGKMERQSQDLARLGERQSKLEERLFWHLVAGGGAE